MLRRGTCVYCRCCEYVGCGRPIRLSALLMLAALLPAPGGTTAHNTASGATLELTTLLMATSHHTRTKGQQFGFRHLNVCLLLLLLLNLVGRGQGALVVGERDLDDGASELDTRPAPGLFYGAPDDSLADGSGPGGGAPAPPNRTPLPSPKHPKTLLPTSKETQDIQFLKSSRILEKFTF